MAALGVILIGCAQEQPPPAVPVADSPAERSLQPEAGSAVQTSSEPEPDKPYVPVEWDHESNLFENASFEMGREPWFALNGPEKPYWMDFEISDRQAHSGEHSALFELQSHGEIHRGTRIWGVIRDFELDAIPRRISGWYRVDDWKRGAVNQYLQVVICVFDPALVEFPALRGSPVQLSYVLAGIEHPPFRIGNRRFIFAGPLEPVTGEWVRFDFDLHAGFIEQWGRVPRDFGTLRVFFEARFDDKHPAPDLSATVYFDDLYLGDGGAKGESGGGRGESQEG